MCAVWPGAIPLQPVCSSDLPGSGNRDETAFECKGPPRKSQSAAFCAGTRTGCSSLRAEANSPHGAEVTVLSQPELFWTQIIRDH